MARNLDQLIAEAAARHGIPETTLRRYIKIESNFDPNNRTGSYKGLLQLSDREFRKYGGQGNIYDPAANLNAGAAKLAAERNTFAGKYGRQPTDGELYLVHQQGWGGLQKHLANPDRPAWQNMADTGEGRQKGERWAKLAISGNVPRKWGVNPETMTSKEFVDRWTARVNGAAQPPSGTIVAQAIKAEPKFEPPPGAPPPGGDTPDASLPTEAPQMVAQAPQPPQGAPEPQAPPSVPQYVAQAPQEAPAVASSADGTPSLDAIMSALGEAQSAFAPPKRAPMPPLPDVRITPPQNKVALLGSMPIASLVPKRV